MSGYLNLAFLGLTNGSMYALVGVSFGLIWGTSHVFHLAHGAVAAVAGYAIIAVTVLLSGPLWTGIAAAAVIAPALGMSIHFGIYRPLETRGANFAILLMASVAVLILIEGLLGLGFGPAVSYPRGLANTSWNLGGVIAPASRVFMLTAWFFIVGLFFWLRKSRYGRVLRAISDSPRVANVTGLRADRALLVVYALGSAMMLPVAIMVAWNQGLTPGSGLPILLVGSAAMMIAGKGRLALAAGLALVIGLLQALLIELVPSVWAEAVLYSAVFLAITGKSMLSSLRWKAAG